MKIDLTKNLDTFVNLLHELGTIFPESDSSKLTIAEQIEQMTKSTDMANILKNSIYTMGKVTRHIRVN